MFCVYLAVYISYHNWNIYFGVLSMVEAIAFGFTLANNTLVTIGVTSFLFFRIIFYIWILCEERSAERKAFLKFIQEWNNIIINNSNMSKFERELKWLNLCSDFSTFNIVVDKDRHTIIFYGMYRIFESEYKELGGKLWFQF
jgi:hypothetical protein